MSTKKKTVYSPETKAAALAALLEGQGAHKVAADFNLPAGTVRAWQNRMQQNASPLRHVATQKADEIGGLLVEYLHANLATLEAQSVFFRDTNWLKLQTAADAAVLHGVITDKTIRLLEALGGNHAAQPTG